jgi:flagellar hook-length control protein FliK
METTKISSPQGHQPAHGTRSRSSANPPEAGDAGGGGFLALLAALGSADPGVDPLLDTAITADAAAQDSASDGQDASFLAAWQGLIPQGGNTPADAGRQGGQDGALLGGGSSAPGLGALGTGAPGGAAFADMPLGANGQVQGLVAETAMLDASVGNKGGLTPGGAMLGRSFSRQQSAMALKADAADASAGRLHLGASAQVLAGQPAAVAGVLMNPGERQAGGAAVGLPERASGNPGGAGGLGSEGFALTEGTASIALAAGSSGGDARSRPGEGRSESAAGFEAAGMSAPSEGGSVDGAAVFADPAQAGLEEQLAEQVTYWVNQKTQNAELTLDRDGQPVEVSVTVSGNEAHVAFRSDQSATREMLDRSMAQLSELLRSEGLVLSGMSVGTSAGQGENAGDSSRRQGQRESSRQARVEASAPAGAGTLGRAGAPDRAVDVFV